MKITLNGEEVTLDAGLNINELIEKYSLDNSKIAVEKT
jgi:sulfur carrier protein ThiS